MSQPPYQSTPLADPPRALFMIERKSFDFVIGNAQRLAFESLADFPYPHSEIDISKLPLKTCQSIDVIISGWGVPLMDETFLDRFPNLKAVFHAAGSVKCLATETLWQRNIRVTSAARLNAIPVAEFTFSQIVFCLKHGWQTALDLRENKIFRPRDGHIPGTTDSTVGILSLGHTGQEVIKRLRALEVNTIAYDPFASPQLAASLDVELVSLEEIFQRSHVVSCHTPLLPETRGMLRKEHFESMRSGSSFINTARGAIVNEPELIEALTARPDVFAVLDVTHPEPVSPTSALLSLPNAIVTPHIAGSLSYECRKMGGMMLSELSQFLKNQPLAGEIMPHQLTNHA